MRRLIGRVDKGETLREVGAGTGWWSRFFSGRGYYVNGVDVSTKMIVIASMKKIPDARFQIADGHALPFQDGSFDASAAITTIEFAKDPERIISEMIRCIKPGGRLILGVLNGDALLNKKRKEKGNIFLTARFFTADELHTLLVSYGKPVLKTCAFPLSVKIPQIAAATADDIQVLLKMTSGAFIAATVYV
jgi:ubiquinone/menaquinone biosynthesis C-methylase UbiE